jgi:hypothetical protein
VSGDREAGDLGGDGRRGSVPTFMRGPQILSFLIVGYLFCSIAVDEFYFYS